jgi:hypothetical protein
MDMRWKARKERQWRNHAGRCEACLACVVDGQRWSGFLLVLKVVLVGGRLGEVARRLSAA